MLGIHNPSTQAEAGGSLNWILIGLLASSRAARPTKWDTVHLKNAITFETLFCVHMCTYICGHTHVEARGSLTEISSPLPPRELRELNWGPQAWWQLPLPTESPTKILAHLNFYLKISLISNVSSNWGFKVFQAVQTTCFLYAALTLLEFAL